MKFSVDNFTQRCSFKFGIILKNSKCKFSSVSYTENRFLQKKSTKIIPTFRQQGRMQMAFCIQVFLVESRGSKPSRLLRYNVFHWNCSPLSHRRRLLAHNKSDEIFVRYNFLLLVFDRFNNQLHFVLCQSGIALQTQKSS